MIFGLRKIPRSISKVRLTFFFVFDFREKFVKHELLSRLFYATSLQEFFYVKLIFIDFKPFCMVFRLRKISRRISKVGLTFFLGRHEVEDLLSLHFVRRLSTL